MLSKEEATKLYEENGRSFTRASAKAGIPRSTFTMAYRGNYRGAVKAADSPSIGKSLSEFRETFDKNVIIPRQIREGLKKLGNAWDYEAAFAKACGVSITDISNFRDEFSDNWHSLKREGRRVWGSKSMIKSIKATL